MVARSFRTSGGSRAKKGQSESSIKKTTLDNGARIITEVVEDVYSASIGIWVDVGSEDETPKNNGASHCLEHMFFKGTGKRTAEQIAQEIEDVGGSIGAATGKENTCFYSHVLGEHLPVAVDLLTDMLLHATIDKKDLDLERQVILEEIKMYDDDPEDFAHEQLILNIWPDHPLSRPITGTHESVSGITRKTLVDHIEDYYTPEKWVISIAGNFDEEQAVADFSKVLKPLKRGSKTKNETVPKMVPFESVKYRDIEQTHISIATNGIHATDPRRFQLSILDLCLGGNMSSRLFQEVREKRGLVYSINTFRESHRKNGLFGVYAAASPVHVGEILELVGKEFKRACKSGFSKQEIERGKTQLKSELLLGLESMRNRTARNAYSELFYERQLSVEELCDDINKVTAEEIHELTNQILISDQMSLVIVGPEEGLEYLPKKNLFSF